MNLFSNAEHFPKTKTSQKSLLKSFYYNNKGTKKVKDSQKLSNKEIYFIPLLNSAKYNKPCKFILWPNLLEGHHTAIFSVLKSGVKLLLIGLRIGLIMVLRITLNQDRKAFNCFTSCLTSPPC